MTSNYPCLTQPADTSNFVRIIAYPPLGVNMIGFGNTCPDAAVTLIANANGGDGGPYSYSWRNSILDTSSIIVFPHASAYFPVTVRDQCGSAAVRDSVLIHVFTAPHADFTFLPADPSTINNTVGYVDNSTNAVSWTWIFSDSDTVTTRNPMHTFIHPGNYTVSLVTQSADGCVDTIRYSFVVREDYEIYIPNSFTPNGDYYNETWRPFGKNLGEYEFYIFNRWGENIFTGSELKPWDGSVNGTSRLAHDGVYVYQLHLKNPGPGADLITGRVTLIR
jgi:gliding motility-associated-like protein